MIGPYAVEDLMVLAVIVAAVVLFSLGVITTSVLLRRS